MREIVVPAVDRARADDRHRRLAPRHLAHLHVARVRAQEDARVRGAPRSGPAGAAWTQKLSCMSVAGWSGGKASLVKLFSSSSTSRPPATTKPRSRKMARSSSRAWRMGCAWPRPSSRRPGRVRSKGRAAQVRLARGARDGAEARLERGLDVALERVDLGADASGDRPPARCAGGRARQRARPSCRGPWRTRRAAPARWSPWRRRCGIGCPGRRARRRWP